VSCENGTYWHVLDSRSAIPNRRSTARIRPCFATRVQIVRFIQTACPRLGRTLSASFGGGLCLTLVPLGMDAKGFASVVYGLLVLTAGLAASERLFALIALTVVVSIVAHSSTDVLIARWFRNDAGDGDGRPAGGADAQGGQEQRPAGQSGEVDPVPPGGSAQ
jgi:hypothetical protein